MTHGHHRLFEHEYFVFFAELAGQHQYLFAHRHPSRRRPFEARAYEEQDSSFGARASNVRARGVRWGYSIDKDAEARNASACRCDPMDCSFRCRRDATFTRRAQSAISRMRRSVSRTEYRTVAKMAVAKAELFAIAIPRLV
jgi:hypothetical protein